MWPKLDNLKVTLATPKNTTSCWNFLFIFWYHVEYCLNFMYGEFQVEILSGQSYLNFQKFELTLATFLLSSISPRGECQLYYNNALCQIWSKSGKLYMWPKLPNIKVTLATPKNTTSCWNFLFIFWYHVEYCLNFMYGEFQVEILSGQSYLNFQKFELTLATFLLSSISPRVQIQIN